MSLVSVKNKFQVVIPLKVREKIGIQVGDLLEARVERGKITFTPKSVLDRAVAETGESGLAILLHDGRQHLLSA